MITRQGKQYVLFAGLLDAFHEKQNDFDDARPVMETELLEKPSDNPGGVAIVHARAGFKLLDGSERWVFGPFDGIGDASAENVGKNIEPHKIRMAETRAKARALRDLLNINAEVLEDAEDSAPPTSQRSSTGRGSRSTSTRTEQPAKSPDEVEGVQKGAAKQAKGSPDKVRKSQVDMLKTLATEWRGENGVERLETRLGKPLTELTKQEANEWIDRLTPEGRE